jgi:hypothetical protein
MISIIKFSLLLASFTFFFTCASAQSDEELIYIFKPNLPQYEQDFYHQVIEQWNEVERKTLFEDSDIQTIVNAIYTGFSEAYIDKLFSKLGYKVIWKYESQKSTEMNQVIYGEVSKKLTIFKSEAKMVSTYLKIYDNNGVLLYEGEPKVVYKQMKKIYKKH